MKHTLLFGCILFGFAFGEQTYKYKIEWLEVPLDQFSYAVNKTFKIRYLINDTFAKNDGPILFYTGNEGNIELFAENTGFIWQSAPKLGALIVFAEHRYYGQSLPFGADSFKNIDNFGFLRTEQALADYAQLLRKINSDNKRAVMAIGGSYGGMLAAWFRTKYPHLVAGALASSAPVLQFGNATPCDSWGRITTEVFRTSYNNECVLNIEQTWTLFKNLASTPDGRKQLNDKFKFCKGLDKPEDLEEFISYLNDVYGNLAMANYPYPNTFLAPLPAYPVREFCSRLDKPYKDTQLLDAFVDALSIYTGPVKCLNTSSAYDDNLGITSWNFQACTELIMPQCQTSRTMFIEQKWDPKTYSDQCFAKYGAGIHAEYIERTYGLDRLTEYASNIIFSNGLLDPWSGGGVLRSVNEKIVVLIIPEGAHHLDLRTENKNDPSSVIQARATIVNWFKVWSKEWNNKIN